MSYTKEKPLIGGTINGAGVKQKSDLSYPHHSTQKQQNQDPHWHELRFDCPDCRRNAKRNLHRLMPIKTSPRTIWAFGTCERVFGTLDKLGIDYTAGDDQ